MFFWGDKCKWLMTDIDDSLKGNPFKVITESDS